MSDDVILLKLEEDFTCPITQVCLLISWLLLLQLKLATLSFCHTSRLYVIPEANHATCWQFYSWQLLLFRMLLAI